MPELTASDGRVASASERIETYASGLDTGPSGPTRPTGTADSLDADLRGLDALQTETRTSRPWWRRLVDGARAVVHCAGTVRGATAAEFHAANVEGVARLATVAAEGPSVCRRRTSASTRSVIAPMFAMRALDVRSWAGTNLLGGGDGATLAEPEARRSKIESKAAGLEALLGHPVDGPLHIDHVADLGDWKTAWDHITFAGFLGTSINPPSVEQYDEETNFIIELTGKNEVFWTKSGKVYHLCEAVSAVNMESADNQIYAGTVADAHAAGKERLTLQVDQEIAQCGLTPLEEGVDETETGTDTETEEAPEDVSAELVSWLKSIQ